MRQIAISFWFQITETLTSQSKASVPQKTPEQTVWGCSRCAGACWVWIKTALGNILSVISCDLDMVHESPFYVYLTLAEKKTLELPNSVTKSSRFWFWKKWWRAWPTASAPFAQFSITIFSNSMSKTSTRMFKFTLHASKKMLESTAPWAWSTQRWNWNWLPPKSGTSSLGLVVPPKKWLPETL